LGEINDLSKKYPQKVEELEKMMMDYVKDVKAEGLISGVSPKKATKDDED